MNASQTQLERSASPLAPEAASAKLSYGGPEAAALRQQFARGNLDGLRQYLASTRQAKAWHDRIMMLDALAPAIPLDVLETICAVDPDSADLAVVRCAYYSAYALDLRGTGPLDQISESRLRKAASAVRTAIAALEEATKFDPSDPTPYACITPALGIFDQHKTAMQRAFLQATALAPELAPLLSFGSSSPTLSAWPN